MENENKTTTTTQETSVEQAKETTKTEPESQGKEVQKEQTKDDKTLTEQLQSALVEIAKLKRAVDKSSSEAADYKKKWKESMTEAEQASLEKAEAQAKREEEYENLKRMVRVNELTENFMDLGYSKDLARKAAAAQTDGDTETLLDIQKQFQTDQQKKWEADFIKSRPELKSGVGSGSQTITKEDFDKMTLIEKSKLRRENEAEYKRLIAL